MPVNELHQDTSPLKCSAVSIGKDLPVHKSVTAREDNLYQHRCEDAKSGNMLLITFLIRQQTFYPVINHHLSKWHTALKFCKHSLNNADLFHVGMENLSINSIKTVTWYRNVCFQSYKQHIRINFLKPVSWCTNSLTFNNCTFCPHCIYVFCIYLRTNSDLCHLQPKLTGFYNRDEKCLLRGTNWVFK